jgi:ribosomal-protein-alanine N-acetyltransferase
MQIQKLGMGQKQEFWPFLKKIKEQSPYLSESTYSQMENSISKGQIYILKEEDRFTAYMEYLDLGNQEFEILQIAVAKAFRKSGYGKRLWENFLEKYQAQKVYLEVHEKNIGALCFYRGLGFVKDAIRQNYYKDGGSAVLMSWQRPKN